MNCPKHQQQQIYVCCLSEWHCEALCSDCIPEHTKNHNLNKQIPMIEKIEDAVKICDFNISYEKVNSGLDQIQKYSEEFKLFLKDSGNQQDTNWINIQNWKNQIMQCIEGYFSNLENWYNNQRSEVFNQQTFEIEEILKSIEKEKQDLQEIDKNLSNDQTLLKGIKFSFNKNYQQKYEQFKTKFEEIKLIKVESTLALNQKNFDQIQTLLNDFIWKDENKNANKDGKQQTKQKPKEKQHFCPQCGEQMVYVSSHKKHLQCPKCAGVKRPNNNPLQKK